MFSERLNRVSFVFVVLCTFVVSSCASDDLRGLLLGHPATHWSPPAGKTVNDTEADLAACYYPTPTYFSCMKTKGYRAIELYAGKPLTEEEKVIIQRDTTVTTGLFALDLRTKDIFIGTANSVVGSQTFVVSIKGLRTNTSCKGNAKIETATTTAEGSTGKAKLICTDGRVISATFVYEDMTSGYGVGLDMSGTKYQFIFGKFDINEDALIKEFRKIFKNIPAPLKENKV